MLVWWLILGLIGCAVLAFLGAIVLQVAASWVRGVEIDTERAYTTALCCNVATFFITAGVGFAFSRTILSDDGSHTSLVLFSMVASFVACTGILIARHRVDMARALLVTLLTQLIWSVAVGAVWGVWAGGGALYRFGAAWLRGDI
jgi:hypothetical protein